MDHLRTCALYSGQEGLTEQ